MDLNIAQINIQGNSTISKDSVLSLNLINTITNTFTIQQNFSEVSQPMESLVTITIKQSNNDPIPLGG